MLEEEVYFPLATLVESAKEKKTRDLNLSTIQSLVFSDGVSNENDLYMEIKNR